MTEEIMPREDRMGKILTFIGGCLAGVIGVFTVAAMSEISQSTDMSSNSDEKVIVTPLTTDESSDSNN